MIDACIAGLLRYAEDTGLIEADDRLWARNRLLEALQLDGCDPNCAPAELPLADLLRELTEDAVSRGVAQDNSVARDLFDTKLMGVLTPAPHEVRAKFRSLYAVSPERATDWFYAFSQNTNYIRRDRIARDQKWVYESAYGPLDITINLSKPEKDPRAIAAAKLAPQSGYPKCALCAENEGYAGRMNHPARQNHRVIPVTINGSGWYLQYSPYVYYNEHCIVFGEKHEAMAITHETFAAFLTLWANFPTTPAAATPTCPSWAAASSAPTISRAGTTHLPWSARLSRSLSASAALTISARASSSGRCPFCA